MNADEISLYYRQVGTLLQAYRCGVSHDLHLFRLANLLKFIVLSQASGLC
jgi:hypothetical protein